MGIWSELDYQNSRQQFRKFPNVIGENRICRLIIGSDFGSSAGRDRRTKGLSRNNGFISKCVGVHWSK